MRRGAARRCVTTRSVVTRAMSRAFGPFAAVGDIPSCGGAAGWYIFGPSARIQFQTDQGAAGPGMTNEFRTAFHCCGVTR